MVEPLKDLIIIDRETAEKLLAATGFTFMSTRLEIHRKVGATKYPSNWIVSDLEESICQLQAAIKKVDDFYA